jgi:hypothetical protein
MLTLIPVILSLLEQGIPIVESIIQAGKAEAAAFNSGTAPTAAQQAQIDAALAAANTALQNS